ncbi:putative variable tail fiber protein [uncultured Mediterranean phage uvMED]|nr:putative variable tail fiber protein [uncultured Mediterranean phage uvMED]
MSEIQANKLSPASGTALQVGDSGDVITIPSGATITNSGTASGFGGDNTPSFYATSSSANSLVSANYYKINFNTEVVDTDSAYDTSSYRFTVPSGEGGKYWISASWGADSGNDTDKISVFVRKNGSNIFGMTAVNKAYNSTNVSGMAVLSAGDYIEAFAYQDSGTTYNINTDSTFTFFMGYKLIGV